MKSFNTRLILSALGLALIATPAFAQGWYRHPSPRVLYNSEDLGPGPVGVYPNPVPHTGSAAQIDSGAAFSLDRGY
jgi:hypothetical protein